MAVFQEGSRPVRISDVATPTTDNDAATKIYVDEREHGTDNLADGSVTTAKLADGAVSFPKLDDNLQNDLILDFRAYWIAGSETDSAGEMSFRDRSGGIVQSGDGSDITTLRMNYSGVNSLTGSNLNLTDTTDYTEGLSALTENSLIELELTGSNAGEILHLAVASIDTSNASHIDITLSPTMRFEDATDATNFYSSVSLVSFGFARELVLEGSAVLYESLRGRSIADNTIGYDKLTATARSTIEGNLNSEIDHLEQLITIEHNYARTHVGGISFDSDRPVAPRDFTEFSTTSGALTFTTLDNSRDNTGWAALATQINNVLSTGETALGIAEFDIHTFADGVFTGRTVTISILDNVSTPAVFNATNRTFTISGGIGNRVTYGPIGQTLGTGSNLTLANGYFARFKLYNRNTTGNRLAIDTSDITSYGEDSFNYSPIADGSLMVYDATTRRFNLSRGPLDNATGIVAAVDRGRVANYIRVTNRGDTVEGFLVDVSEFGISQTWTKVINRNANGDFASYTYHDADLTSAVQARLATTTIISTNLRATNTLVRTNEVPVSWTAS